jgi:hypothetical protein
MKTLIVSFAIWIFLVPVVVAMFLISTAVAERRQDLYFTFTTLALALSLLAMVSGPSWLEPFFTAQRSIISNNSATHKFNQEIKHEKSLEGRIHS